jgi:drug/metabolite transporter (DMT)-like permease
MTALRRAGAVFAALPPATRGIVWMTVAALGYVCTYAVVRQLSGRFHTFEIVFFRSALGVLFMLPWLARAGPAALRTRRKGVYAVRVGLNYIGMVFLMWGVANLPLQDVTALMFTVPLFTVLFVALILGETVGLPRWTALLVGFGGAMVIIRPGFAEVSLAMLAVLATCALYALANTCTKSLTQTDNSNAVVFNVFLMMTVAGLGPAIWAWTTPGLADAPWIVAMGLFGSLATIGTTRALAVADASVVMPFNFLKLPFSIVLGFALWAELPDLWTAAGAAIIFTATWYIGRREAAGRPM